AGSLTMALTDNTGSLIQTIGPIPIPAGTGTTIATGATPTTIPINVALPPGTGYRLYTTALSATLIRENSGLSYPYPFGTAGAVTTSWTNGAASAANYYFFYNFQVSTGCESPRIPVTALVNPADPVTVGISPNDTICNGATATLMTSSSNPTYIYSWIDDQGNPIGSGTSVNITPIANTTYYLSAVDANSCTVLDTLEVTVKGVPPTTVTLASPDEVCVVGDVDLTIDPVPAFGIDYQWQKDDGFGFVDIVGATDP